MSNLPKIVILIPCFGRPQLTKFCFEHLSFFKNIVKDRWIIEVVVILSPEDDSFEELENITNTFGFHKYYYKNLRLGAKMNAGIGYVLNNFDFDYLMNFGSDDLLHPTIVDLYKNCLEDKCLFFGINKYYAYDALTGRSFLFRTRNVKTIAVGAGRMIHRSILDSVWKNEIPLYDAVNRALDSCSRINIHTTCNLWETVIDSGNFPFVVDIKTSHNITQLNMLETLNDLYEKADSNLLFDNFEIIKKISNHQFSKSVTNNLSIEKENIPYKSVNKTENFHFSSLMIKYNQLFEAQNKTEYDKDSKRAYMLKLHSDLFYGLMLENMHQEKAQLQSNQKEIMALRNSLSWKVTAPLRYIHSKLFS